MPAEITLPAFLTETLATAPYRHVVHKALENFSDWFRVSRLPFFPDYTDHGIQHIEQVLATAVNLIPDAARPHFSGADAAALILAVLFHDSALHLTDAGFKHLIKGDTTPYAPVAAFDTAGWAQTWADFMFLARRWDDAKLLNVFGGDERSGVPTATVRDPFLHWDNLTRTDYLLVGEFIRQQHPRLAHEMALHGVPGTTGPLLKLDDSLPAEWCDLVGLIARSHGLSLRACLDYLKNAPDFGEAARREYQGIHAVYLMALLRVADYIQIQGDRTSNRIFNYKKIYSSISTVEHKVHQSVRNITNTADDPEALFIQARPEEVAVFLRLQEWLAGIQQELDGSWAVLGEVYGRHDGLNSLGLTFRRVRSNLDNVKEFAETVSYVPDRIRFDVARAELLKLLIGPLYGDDPSYGVRELMQNSIDAVREYDQFVLDNPEYANVPRREQEDDVFVELGPFDEENGYAVMTISDRGIGMTEATVRDYFLRAGASYRSSPQWKLEFEVDTEIEAKSRVLRSGHFGIGALSAFLIGEKIKVETRHIKAESGYAFSVTLDFELVEVIKIANMPVGTKITIQVSSVDNNKLLTGKENTVRPRHWDWYCFSYPTVRRKFLDNKKNVNIGNKINLNLTGKHWRKMVADLPYEVYWTHADAPKLTCNGIFVSNSSAFGGIPNRYSNHWSFPRMDNGRKYYETVMDYPNLAIIDADGNFPLNLQRTNIQSLEYPFADLLVRDMLQETVAKLFFNGPVQLDDSLIASHSWSSLSMPGGDGLVACYDGYGLRLKVLLENKKVERVIWYSDSALEISQVNDALVFSGSNDFARFNAFSHIRFRSNKKSKSYQGSRKIVYHPDFIRISDDALSKAESLLHLTTEWRKGGLLSVTTGENAPEPCFQIEAYDTKLLNERFKSPNAKYHTQESSIDIPLLEEVIYSPGYFIHVASEPWLLDELWQEHFGKDWIPFALEDRIAKFPKAAKFFAERYPQVVPVEAWALLGGKPVAEK